jgi:hypothetical protein
MSAADIGIKATVARALNPLEVAGSRSPASYRLIMNV